MTCFCKVRNEITEINDIDVIITFKDAVRDVKTIEMLALKKPKTVAELLGIAEQCVEMAEARARLEPQKKSTRKEKSHVWEVANTGRERLNDDQRERDCNDCR